MMTKGEKVMGVKAAQYMAALIPKKDVQGIFLYQS